MLWFKDADLIHDHSQLDPHDFVKRQTDCFLELLLA